MLHTIEVEIDAAGHITPLEAAGRLPPGRALLTLLSALTDSPSTPAPTGSQDWRAFVGTLKGSPHFEGDPVVIQQAMRDEWS
ncbi:MAG: hypothetical protein WCF85_09650 [Rhodospirillaceae bacterium]